MIFYNIKANIILNNRIILLFKFKKYLFTFLKF